MKGKYIILFILILLIVVPVSEASDISFFYKIKNNSELNDPNLIGVSIENYINNNFLFSATASGGNLIGDSKDCQQYNVNLYKKIPFKSDFDYFVGLGYNYEHDDSDKLQKNLLFFNLKGINEKQEYSVISEISFAPLGTYSFNEENLQNMNAWNIKLTFKTYIVNKINISLSGAVGGDIYKEFSNSNNEYKFGIGWDL